MSASEKLKALAVDGWPDPDFSQSQGAEAWAQIVTVVEAAERVAEVAHDFQVLVGPITRQEVIPALAALEEALS